MADRSHTAGKSSATQKILKWGFGIVVAALGAFLTAQLTGVFHKAKDAVLPPPEVAPITVIAETKPTCPLVFTSPPEEVQRTFDQLRATTPTSDLSAAGSLDGTETTVEITVQGRSVQQAVVLSDLRAKVVERRPPEAQFATAGCGALQPVRLFNVDLDTSATTAVPVPDSTSESSDIPTEFKLRVSATDPEVLHVTARTQHCDCQWVLELTWTAGDTSKTIEIDDHGKPFRTVAVDAGLPLYYLNADQQLTPAG